MRNQKTCLFTGTEASWHLSLGPLALHYCDSIACGSYNITESAILRARDTIQRAGINLNQSLINCGKKNLIYHEENLNTRYYPIWCAQDEKEFLEENSPANPLFVIEESLNDLIDHSEKPMILLSRLGKKLSRSKAFAPFQLHLEDQIYSSIVDISELTSIISHLLDMKYIAHYRGSEKIVSPTNGPSETIFHNKYSLTVDGWHQLRLKTALSSKKVFIATAFKWLKDDEIRPKAIQAIKDACSELGYEAETVSQNHSDYITNRIISEIRQARFVIAELTYHNRGVYFEAGLTRGLGKPVFHVVRTGFTSTDPNDDPAGKRIHFDIQQIIYRQWDSPEKLKELLKEWIEASEGRAT